MRKRKVIVLTNIGQLAFPSGGQGSIAIGDRNGMSRELEIGMGRLSADSWGVEIGQFQWMSDLDVGAGTKGNCMLTKQQGVEQ